MKSLISKSLPLTEFVTVSVPTNLPSQTILASFVLFLHKTFSLEVVCVKADETFIFSSLDPMRSFQEFENQLSYCDQKETPFSFSTLQINPSSLGAFLNAGELVLFSTQNKYDHETLVRWKSHMENLLKQIAVDPSVIAKKICYLSNEERTLILEKWNATDWIFPDQKMLHEFIEEQAIKTPHAEAVRFQECSLSYQQLNVKANQLAHLLRSKSITRETLVAICMERSIELVIGLLGILKAGAAYVPMDPSYPEERLRYILEDSKAKVLLTHASKKNLLIDTDTQMICLDESDILNEWSHNTPPLINDANDLCYVIYTSGSTGKPKGVGNIHRGVVNRILWMQEMYQLNSSDRVLQKTPFGFDVSVWEFFWPLMTGATLVMADPGIHKDAEAIAELIEKEEITHLHFVPSMLNLFLEADVSSKCNSLKKVFTSGEALSYDLQSRFFAQYKAQLHNLYGPTEASIDVTYWPCDPNDKRTIVPIGYPIANTQIYILDEYLQPVPIGVAGELFIGGVGLARGYIHRDELTKEKFIDHPFKKGERLYRTGDLCRFLADGAIEYLGRLDHQIKLRGFRIELGEIESEIRKHPHIKNAVVIAREDVIGDKYLCAYIITEQDLSAIKKELISSLSTSLPEYMIPSSFVLAEEFPLNPNGKLDIKRLPQPKEKERVIVSEYIEAVTPMQKELQQIWKDILKHHTIGVEDNFFALGGHSLLAMRLVLNIKKKMKKQITLPEIFQYPTIAKLAELLSSKEEAIKEEISFVPHPADRYKPFSLTDIQKAYLLGRTDAFALGGIRSHIYVENEHKDFDISRLEAALNLLIQRHDMLRAVIFEDGTQMVLEKAPYYSIKVIEGKAEQTRKEILREKKQSLYAPFFDVYCTKTEKQTVVIHFYFDLLIADGTGLEIFFEELSLLYKNINMQLPPLNITFRDCILALETKTLSFVNAKEYWHKRIDSLPEAPELATKRLLQDTSPAFVRRRGRLDPKEWQQLQSQASYLGITVAALIVTIYGEVIKTWCRSPHFSMNLMFFNRPPLHPDIDRVVGNFSTTLLLEMNLQGNDSLKTNGQKIQKQLLEDLEHSQYNGIKVLNEMNRKKGGSSAAAMPVVFACALNLRSQNKQREPELFKWYGQGVSYNQLETPQVWLDHQVYEDEDGSLCFFWDVRDEYFPDGLIEKMFSSYQNYLKAAAQDVETKHSLVPEEDLRLVELVNATEVPYQDDLLHTAIIDRAKSHSTSIAVMTSSLKLTYRELANAVLALSNRISFYKPKPNDLIAIVMEKGWEQIAAALAIHASGAAYIPIDAALPKERILQLLTLSEAKAYVAQKPLNLPVTIPCLLVNPADCYPNELQFLSSQQKPSDLAYVIFTSGSTGIPKGVMIEHRAAVNTIHAINQKYKITEKDIAFAISSLSFDLSVFDIFGLLRAGGTIYIPTNEEIKNPELWLKAIEEKEITIWNSAPALMQVLIDSVDLHSSALRSKLRLVMMSGDWIPITLPDRIKTHFQAEVISLGGATEASIWSNDFHIDKVEKHWTSIPYGKPLANHQMRVLDENLNPRAVWATGMIYIGGKGLARGYYGDEEKTKNSFIIHPTTQERLYRTGDLGRLCPDGNIEFLGREDLQVKIQGYRIELEEIETLCREIEEIQQVLVRIIGEKHEAKRLAAFYTLKTPIEPYIIKEYLEKRLPFYMVPNHFVALERFPLNSNGKVDIKGLMSLLKEGNSSSDVQYEEPKGKLEFSLARIWQELLDVPRVGRLDNFFALGGTSFLAFQMIHKVQKDLNLSFSLSTLFQKGTIAQLLETEKSEDDPSFVILQSEGEESPVFFIHPSGGGVLCYTELAQLLGKERPFYAFQAPGFVDGRQPISSIEEMAQFYLQIILSKQKKGPFLLGGWSFGGVVSFEISIQLKSMGHEVLRLFMIDSPSPLHRKDLSDKTMRKWFLEDYGDQLNSLDEKSKELLFQVFRTNILSLSNYQPKKVEQDIVLMKATTVDIEHLQDHPMSDEDDWGWKQFSSGHIASHLLDANHNSILKSPYISHIVEKMRDTFYQGIISTLHTF